MSLAMRAKVARAAAPIVPSWPLDSFIAVNPLGGDEQRPFELARGHGVALTRPLASYRSDLEVGRITTDDLVAALRERVPEVATPGEVVVGDTRIDAASILATELTLSPAADTQLPNHGPALDLIDQLTAKWVAAYLDPEPLWEMPGRTAGLYGAWRLLARHDSHLPRLARRALRDLPERSDDALEQSLTALGVAEHDVDRVLRAELRRLPGWVSHLKWRSEKVGDVDLTSYLALRFCLRRALGAEVTLADPEEPRAAETPEALWARAADVARALANGAQPRDWAVADVAHVLVAHPPHEHPFTMQRAYELHYRDRLLGSLGWAPRWAERPAVQLVMCIDPRSEGIRRHLEPDARIETIGFAGFFGVPMRFASYRARAGINSLPALLAPHHAVTEAPANREMARRRTAALRLRDALARGIHAGDTVTAAPFAFAETTGWLLGITTALRTLAPRTSARLSRRVGGAVAPGLSSEVTVAVAFSLDERVSLAETAVRMMGLDRLAPLVVLAGHGSTSTNNLYESALDCGACGGNPGAANARAAATILNDPEVRAVLARRGLSIPDDTVFVAAEHNTVSDRLTALDEHLVPITHLERLATFLRQADEAADANVLERARELPGASPEGRPERVRRRADDWAEVYPELGLAGNAAFIVGPRELTRGVDLGRRVFLHSYRVELDPDGTALETILTAPLVVAQWINHQYYFSALNPETLSAGTKTVHNAIGTLGVLSGHSGDLRRGLPWQSVGFGTELFHEPMRLAVVVQAPLDRVGLIVSRNQVLRDLFDNGWITLVARDDELSSFHRYTPYGWVAAMRRASTNNTDSPEGAQQ